MNCPDQTSKQKPNTRNVYGSAVQDTAPLFAEQLLNNCVVLARLKRTKNDGHTIYLN